MPSVRSTNRTLKTREAESSQANSGMSSVKGAVPMQKKYIRELDESGTTKVWKGKYT